MLICPDCQSTNVRRMDDEYTPELELAECRECGRIGEAYEFEDEDAELTAAPQPTEEAPK